MEIQFCGANREVTGSCHLLRTDEQNILVDCGMFQGGKYADEKNFEDFPFDPENIDVMLLTHAHLDHVGRIPKLVKQGFSGDILMTEGTVPLARIVLEDAQKIMEYENKKYDDPILYSKEDVKQAVSQFKGVKYNKEVSVGNATAVWKDAGHILGSAFIELEVNDKKIGFSGDIGNTNVPILRDTQDLGEVDVLITESTYGNRIHEPRDESEEIMLDLIKKVCRNKGSIMIPAFSIERTQELLYALHKVEENDSDLLDGLPIYLDSPMAIDVTKVFEDFPHYFDQEAYNHFLTDDSILKTPTMEFTYDKEASKQINNSKPPKMIIAGAGMMNGGRIIHHAFRYLPDESSALLIVGYQADGTLGRKLYEGAETVEIFDQDVEVNADIKSVGGMSAHGDQKKLLDWIDSADTAPDKIYCVHGEPEAATQLAHRAKEKFDTEAFIPEFSETVQI